MGELVNFCNARAKRNMRVCVCLGIINELTKHQLINELVSNKQTE